LTKREAWIPHNSIRNGKRAPATICSKRWQPTKNLCRSFFPTECLRTSPGERSCWSTSGKKLESKLLMASVRKQIRFCWIHGMVLALFVLSVPAPVPAYSVLTHEQVVD